MTEAPPTFGRRLAGGLSRLGARELWPLWIAVGYIAFRGAYFFASRSAIGIDNHAYWLADHQGTLYHNAPATRDAYLYAPVFAQVLWPIAQLPWPVFFGLWIVAETATFVWLLWPLGPGWGVVALLLCTFEIQQGNILGFLAALLVVGMQRPGLWAFSLLTKITTSLGPLWFLARREWRLLWGATWCTLAIAGVSFAFSPHEWVNWLQFLWHHRGGSGFFPLRIAIAAAVTVFAARTNRAWLLAPALVLASPVLQGIQYLTLLTAIPRLRRLAIPDPRSNQPWRAADRPVGVTAPAA